MQAEHCSESWKSTLYGESSFTREPQTGIVVVVYPASCTDIELLAETGFHSPGEAGEFEDEEVVKSDPCNAGFQMFTSVWVLSLVVLLHGI
jgi:hypothetical protein